MNALLIDFGSTYTKLRAVTLNPVRVLASGQGPSTVSSDVSEGMNAALGDLESHMGARLVGAFAQRLTAVLIAKAFCTFSFENSIDSTPSTSDRHSSRNPSTVIVDSPGEDGPRSGYGRLPHPITTDL